jgi:branched-subunit amino acid ABC-type transport system permease component
MAKERLTPQDLDARLKFILGITLGSILFITAVGIMYALIFVTQPITGQSENDKMFFNVLGSVATFITGTLAGLLIGRSGSDAVATAVKDTVAEITPSASEVTPSVAEVKTTTEEIPAAKLDDPNYN